MRWWESRPDLLEREIGEMAVYSGASLEEIDGQLAWLETVVTDFGQIFDIAIVYPISYPVLPPRGIVVNPAISSAPHRFSDGSLCLFPPSAPSFKPGELPAVTVGLP